MIKLFKYISLSIVTFYLIYSSNVFAGKILKYDLRKQESLHDNSVLFFMHGWGSSKKKWYKEIISEFGDDFTIVILQAPYRMGWFSWKFSWYDWQVVDGDTTSNQEQINFSSQSVLRTIDHIIRKQNLDIKNVFIGGQSQGAIIACKLASEYPESMRGFIVHNGRLPVVFNPVNSDSFSKLHGLILNGKYDKVLPPKYAKSIVNKFKNLGVNIDSISLEIGHGMPKESWRMIQEWINSIIR